jgi:hypothetical protein
MGNPRNRGSEPRLPASVLRSPLTDVTGTLPVVRVVCPHDCEHSQGKGGGNGRVALRRGLRSW